MFKLLSLSSLLFLFSGIIWAQSMEENYQKKIASPFMSKANWVKTFKDALEQSKSQNKLIMGYFTRSYAP
ncbi:MAG: hypothetical protein AABZ60_06175 [Planctomycetota bacterium]